MAPLVSVCIPTYNASKYLNACIESIVSQTLSDFEILVVDNQSSDQTLEIIESYAKNDSRFRVVVNKKNIGAINNFNRCAELAQGEWIKYVHADDLIAPNCLEMLISAKHSDSELICCRRNFLFGPNVSTQIKKYYQCILSDRSIDNLFPDSTNISAQEFCDVTLRNIGYNIVGEPVAVLLNRNVFYRYGTFNRHIVNKCDVELWARVGVHSGITYVPENLATHRVHDGSVTRGNLSNRRYRQSKIDQLLLFHEFTFNPIYAPLRSAANSHATQGLHNTLALKAYEARRIAEKSSQDTAHSDICLMDEWKHILNYYPAISSASKISLKQRLTHYTRRLKNASSKHDMPK